MHGVEELGEGAYPGQLFIILWDTTEYTLWEDLRVLTM